MLPRDNLVRSAGSYELRAAEGGPLTLAGHFAVFNQWTAIDSHEGRFLERIAPGAFRRTLTEDRASLRVLLEHGRDPQLGNRPIAEIRSLTEDAIGAAYEATLLDGLPPLVVAGLRAGQYGSSFRFRVETEQFVERPQRSDYNPEGLRERTITAARVFEFGPVTFPAYAGATAGLRSLDAWLRDPARLRELVASKGTPR